MIFAKNLKVSTMSQGYTAFTLAEVLITLGIIGIVAAMAIPTLMNNIQNQQFKVALKKEYSIISQAHAMLRAENEIPYNSQFEYQDALLNKLKTIKKCIKPTTGCWHASLASYTYANTPISFTGNAGQREAVLADGALVAIDNGGFNASAPKRGAYGTVGAGTMRIDVNGFKKPNRTGYDIFVFEYYEHGLIPCGAPNAHYNGGFSDGCDKSDTPNTYNNGMDCTYKVIANIDY